MATGEAMLATATNGANDGVIPNPQSGRLTPDRVTNGGKKRLHFKEKSHYAHWDMECANDERPRETAPAY